MSGLVAGAPVHAGGRVVLPVERVWLQVGPGWTAGGREPVAVVVQDAAGTRALGVDGTEADLGVLLETVNGLAAALEAAREDQEEP